MVPGWLPWSFPSQGHRKGTPGSGGSSPTTVADGDVQCPSWGTHRDGVTPDHWYTSEMVSSAEKGNGKPPIVHQ